MVQVLLLTKDDALYNHWSSLNNYGWVTTRADNLSALSSNRANGSNSVLLDARLMVDSHQKSNPINLDTLQIVVADLNPSDHSGQNALVRGASGYIHALMPVAGIDKVLRHVMTGEIWVGKDLLTRMLSQVSKAIPEDSQSWSKTLTARERDVARYVARGHSNQSIADSLGISERTVRAHLSAIFEKLEVTDRLMLALKVHGVQEKIN